MRNERDALVVHIESTGVNPMKLLPAVANLIELLPGPRALPLRRLPPSDV